MRRAKPHERRRRPKGAVQKDLGVMSSDVIDSDAYASLNGCETRLLFGFYRRKWSKKERRYVNENNIIYTLDCMEYEARVSRRAALNARGSLLEVGFIDVCLQADGRLGRPTVYALLERYRQGHPDALVSFVIQTNAGDGHGVTSVSGAQ